MEPIIVGTPIPAVIIWLQFIIPTVAVMITWLIAKREIENRFKIEEKKHNIFRSRKLWELRFAIFKELGELTGKYVAYSSEGTYTMDLFSLIQNLEELQMERSSTF